MTQQEQELVARLREVAGFNLRRSFIATFAQRTDALFHAASKEQELLDLQAKADRLAYRLVTAQPEVAAAAAATAQPEWAAVLRHLAIIFEASASADMDIE